MTLKLGLPKGSLQESTLHLFRKAGFTHFRRAAETPFNLIFEARR